MQPILTPWRTTCTLLFHFWSVIFLSLCMCVYSNIYTTYHLTCANLDQFMDFGCILLRGLTPGWQDVSTIGNILGQQYLKIYRLHEWGHFLKLVGSLPDKAFDSQADVRGPIISRPTTQLDASTLSSLQLHYQETVPLYGNLCARYEAEKRKARGRHKLKDFPPMSS